MGVLQMRIFMMPRGWFAQLLLHGLNLQSSNILPSKVCCYPKQSSHFNQIIAAINVIMLIKIHECLCTEPRSRQRRMEYIKFT